MELDEDHLALAAAGGDASALEALLSRAYDRVLGVCWRLVGPPPACEDLCQEVCLAVAKGLKRFDGRSKFSTWSYAIALNKARDWHRKAGRRARLDVEYLQAEAMKQAANNEEAKRAAWLREAVWELPEDLRETLVLVLEEGLSHAEAADILGLKESTVSWRLMNARKALKEYASTEQGALI